ncbi:hypothetical protein BC936DRAFT_139843 [Jimgerdemannia flammicorona]|uniref:Uncharacterized protein n=1 Tax=Jimgerdemannia flammicorona TaxID=994334 RepID=A0A433B919_9FUNG|nr:hypothetical protein BC936DRAFT_139843 [Jimgerdemannia flammicorona]
MSVTMKNPFKSPPSPPSTSMPSPLNSEASPPPNPITPETPEYIPYTYTVGLRNANPYKHRDILIRGRIPMWVQTLFLNTCLEHLHNAGPLHPNMDYVNLFHFAPYVQVTFREMTSDHMLRGVEPFPIVDMLFERLGFETEELSHDDDTIPPSPEKSTGTNEPDFSDFPPDIAIALNPWPPYYGIPSSVLTGRSTNPLGSKFPTVLWAEIDDEKARVVTEEAEKWMKPFERMMGVQVADGGFGL